MTSAAGTETDRDTPPPGATPALKMGDFQSFPPSVVRDTAERVWAAWTNDLGDAVDRSEAFEILLSVTAAVTDAIDGERPDPAPNTYSVLGRRFLELMRRDFIEQWAGALEPPTSISVLEVLGAVEQVAATIDADWSSYFTSRLSGPDGLDLVVQLAHDLRSPLTSILFLAETLQRGQSGQVNDIQHRQLGLVYGAALGLSSIASDVIELARGGDRLVDDAPTPFSVTEVLESVQDIVRPIAAEKGLSIRVRPPTTDHRLGYPLALSRVLLNLTTNALKFTDEGYVELAVRTSGLSHCEFSVKDTGNGINPDTLASLYQPFRRAKGRPGYCFSGTGLGLAICRRLVTAMGSELQFETESEQGTRFFFALDLPPAGSM